MDKCTCRRCGCKAEKVGIGFAYGMRCLIEIYGEEWD